MRCADRGIKSDIILIEKERGTMEKIRIGVIGIGDISDVYLNNLKKYDAV